MMKSSDTKNEIEKMSQNDLEAIIDGAKSDLPILNLNSVLFGIKFGIKSDEYISLLRDKLIKSESAFFGVPLSNYVYAALDILEIQKYTGIDTVVLNLIKSKDDFLRI